MSDFYNAVLVHGFRRADDSRMKSLQIRWFVLGAIVLVALVLRARGIDSHLPQWTYWDGYVLFDQTAYLRGELGAELPQRTLGYYPYLVSRLAAVLPAMTSSSSDALTAALENASGPWVRIRWASTLLSLFAIVGTYGIARRFMGVGAALFAAALCATSLLHVTFSPSQRPHGAASGAVALALAALLHMRSRGDVKSQLTAGAGVAFAIASLQSGFATMVSWAIAWLCRREKPKWTRSTLAWSVNVVLLVIVVWFFYPFHFDGRAGEGTRIETGADDLTLAGHTIHLSKLTGRGFWVLGSAFVYYDPILTLGVCAALVLFVVAKLRRAPSDVGRRHDRWVCLGYVVPYLAVFGVYDLSYERFALPLVPFASVAAAWAAAEIARFAPAVLRKPMPLAFGAAAVLLAPFAVAWKLGTLRSAPDTFELAAQWLRENADAEREPVFVLQAVDLPLFYAQSSLENFAVPQVCYWTRAQRSMPALAFGSQRFRVDRLARAAPSDDEAESTAQSDQTEEQDFELTPEWLKQQGYSYVVALPLGRNPFGATLRKMRKKGQSALVVSPVIEVESADRRTTDLGFGVVETSTAWSVWKADRLGPRVEVFRL